MPTDERVLVIPADRLHAAGAFHGFRPADAGFLAAVLDPHHFSFRPRSHVETDPTYKQLIPYVILRHGRDVFHYTRGAAGTETRLTARRSVGLGGHISEADAAGGTDPYRTGMRRELAEEVETAAVVREGLIGFINDDSSPVGQVHLGVVHLIDLESPVVVSREAAVAAGGFAAVAGLWADRDRFETWSRFALGELVRAPE